jgi:hypothetical protein
MSSLAKKRLEYWLEICHRLNKEIEEKKALRNLALRRTQKWHLTLIEEKENGN